MAVNADGRRMAQSGQYRSAYEACDKYRPAGYDPLDRFRYNIYTKTDMVTQEKSNDRIVLYNYLFDSYRNCFT